MNAATAMDDRSTNLAGDTSESNQSYNHSRD